MSVDEDEDFARQIAEIEESLRVQKQIEDHQHRLKDPEGYMEKKAFERLRDPDRIDPIIEALRAYWKENPDWRLGQLVFNILRPTGKMTGLSSDLWGIEDDAFLALLNPEES